MRKEDNDAEGIFTPRPQLGFYLYFWKNPAFCPSNLAVGWAVIITFPVLIYVFSQALMPSPRDH